MSDLAETQRAADLYLVDNVARWPSDSRARIRAAIELAYVLARRPIVFRHLAGEFYEIGLEGDERPHWVELIGVEAMWAVLDCHNARQLLPLAKEYAASGSSNPADIVRRAIRREAAAFFRSYCPELESVVPCIGMADGRITYRPQPGARRILTR